MSFGFRVGKDRRETVEVRDDETGSVTYETLRTILEIAKLYDVSAVSLPANEGTSISARSYGEGVIAEVQEEIQKREDQRRRIRILSQLEV